MTMPLPEGLVPEEEVAVRWRHGRKRITVDIEMGDVQVRLRPKYDSIDQLPFVLAALPQVLEQTFAAVDAADEAEEAAQEEA